MRFCERKNRKKRDWHLTVTLDTDRQTEREWGERRRGGERDMHTGWREMQERDTRKDADLPQNDLTISDAK